MKKFNQTAQSALEYSVLIIAVIGALIVSTSYIKRGIQGKLKSSTDDLADQYDPRSSKGVINYTINGFAETTIKTEKDAGGVWTNRIDRTLSTEKKKGSIQVDTY